MLSVTAIFALDTISAFAQTNICTTPAAITGQAAASNVTLVRDVASPEDVAKLKKAIVAEFNVSVENLTFNRAIYFKMDEDNNMVVIFETATDGPNAGQQCVSKSFPEPVAATHKLFEAAFGREVSN